MNATIPTLDTFLTAGYCGPITVLSEARACALRSLAFVELGTAEGAPGASGAYLSAWHQRLRWAYDLATTPAILDAVETLLGPDIVLWATHCWYKAPRIGKRVPWHQDASYWAIEPKKTVSAWIALGATTRENGCLRIVPGSHTRAHEHRAINDPTSWFDRGLDPSEVDEADAVDLELRPGEAVLFNEATLHGSEMNRSDQARVAISCRYTSPEVRFLIDQWKDPGRVRTYLVRGEDRFHLNDAIRGMEPAEERSPSAVLRSQSTAVT